MSFLFFDNGFDILDKIGHLKKLRGIKFPLFLLLLEKRREEM